MEDPLRLGRVNIEAAPRWRTKASRFIRSPRGASASRRDFNGSGSWEERAHWEHPFIQRGLDALNYACYQDARFLLVATPSGVSLAPEGGAHQSIATPLIGMGLDRLTAFEPAYVDELAEILRWALEDIQRPEGAPVYLRLSTRPLDEPERSMDEALTVNTVSRARVGAPSG